MSNLGVNVRLFLLHPEDFRGGEAGESIITGNLDEPIFAQAGANIVTLGSGALVVPEDGRAQNGPLFI